MTEDVTQGTEPSDEVAEEGNQEAIVGEQGEQVAQPAPGLGQDTPVRTSAPSPDSQSGVPLAEDREAGVEPGPVQPGNEGPEDERPEGADQTAASPAEPAE